MILSDGQSRNRLGDVLFEIVDSRVVKVKVRGAYVITDGGFEPVAIFVVHFYAVYHPHL